MQAAFQICKKSVGYNQMQFEQGQENEWFVKAAFSK